MPRGITQEQVNAAADAILGTGENPTVEKVRAELGTGSPNTITRMLDAWRSQLGGRLLQLSALPGVPASVGQVMMELWRLATEHADHAIGGRFANERAQIDKAQAELVRERESWETRLQEAEIGIAQARAARDLAEHACATLDGQLQDSHALRADLVQQRDRLQSLVDQQQVDIHALRTGYTALEVAFQKERDRLAEHVRSLENRAHQEIDRARQEVKATQQHLERTQRDHQQLLTETGRQRDFLHAELRRAEQEAAKQAGRAAALEIALAQAHAQTAKRTKGNQASAKVAPTKPRRTRPLGASKSNRKD